MRTCHFGTVPCTPTKPAAEAVLWSPLQLSKQLTVMAKLAVGMAMLGEARIGEFDSVHSTLQKILGNIVASPDEPKVCPASHPT